jgi:hypothetical protein
VRVVIRFTDNETINAESEGIDPTRFGFFARPLDEAALNNRMVWVPLGSVKYVLLLEAPNEEAPGGDPREASQMEKLVLHFHGGEIMRAYRDDAFSQEGSCFNVRVWDPETHRLMRAIVTTHSLKGIFFVEKWDSRSPEEIALWEAQRTKEKSTARPRGRARKS